MISDLNSVGHRFERIGMFCHIVHAEIIRDAPQSDHQFVIANLAGIRVHRPTLEVYTAHFRPPEGQVMIAKEATYREGNVPRLYRGSSDKGEHRSEEMIVLPIDEEHLRVRVIPEGIRHADCGIQATEAGA